MSWSIKIVGTKDKTVAAAMTQLDKIAASVASYSPTEVADVNAAKVSIASMADSIDNNFGRYGVIISASGSRGSSHCSTSVTVERVELAI